MLRFHELLRTVPAVFLATVQPMRISIARPFSLPLGLPAGHIREALEARRHGGTVTLGASLGTSAPLGTSLTRVGALAGAPHVVTTRSSSPINTYGVSPVLLNLAAR